MLLPHTQSAEELEEEARTALAAFVSKRIGEGTGPYRAAFGDARKAVAELFEATDNLRALTAEVVMETPELLEAARYLGGPPLSQDDLDTLTGGRVSKRKKVDEESAERAVEVVTAFLDPFRCPWLSSGRRPTRTTVKSAVDWTASLWAVERCRTTRRGEYGRRVITAAVLAGVFKVSNLIDAQDAGVYIFWEHDLSPLEEFVRQTTG